LASLAVLATLCGCLLFAAPALAGFGVKSLTVSARNSDGSVDQQAGSHPFEFTTSLVVNQDAEERPEGTLRELVLELPPGLAGNPLALPRCTGAQFEGQLPKCPGNTQVGVASVKTTGLPPFTDIPVYNLTPPLGSPASIGLSIFSDNSFQEASLRSGEDYGVNISDLTLPTDRQIQSITETIWGVPADRAHDSERQCFDAEGNTVHGCSTDTAEKPFLTLPTSCAAPLQTTVRIDSLQNPGAFASETVASLDEHGQPAGMNRCERLPFAPTIEVQPETAAADSPTGLHVDLNIPQNESPAPEQTATAHLKDAVVRLPAGIAVNPSSAAGLGVCTEAQVGFVGFEGKRPRFTPGPAQCPPSSQMATVKVQTPAVDHPLPGTVYLAKQGENPFGSLIALYLTVDDPLTGVVVKLPGKVIPDPLTGQLTTSFQEDPQLPFEDFTLDFTGGPRAALSTPSTCGTFTTTSDLTPWSSPEGQTVKPSDTFQINTGASNGPCVANEAQEPNQPGFEAGTRSPFAGAYSPFVLKLSRENGSQRLGALNVTLPPGMIGRIAGVQECPDAQLAQAAGRSNPGEGALEQSSPSCPQSSEVGTVTAGAGSGNPMYVGGHAYLAGPYEGAPLSLAIVTPAVAGPFDLGDVLVRSALFINPSTAQVTVKSDPIPTILAGIPLDIRSIQVNINRPEFTLNPTSCEPMSVTGEMISTQHQAAALSNRFQVGGCQGLVFKPSFTASTQGKTSKASGASLTVKVSQKPGEANIHKVALTLPLVLPARLTTLQKACTEAQFNANPAGCPPGSFIGTAKAITPILGVPLTGPAILVSHGGAAFPDVVFLLQANERGGTIRIDLDGKTDIKKGITYSRFETVPDAPITSFETVLPQGPHSALAANANLCTSKLSMPTQLTGQNGALVNQTTKIAVTGCPKARTLTRAQKLRLALKACHKKKGAKRKACEHAARKRYAPLKQAKRAKRKG
jgi:hypothetical protein